MQCTFEDNTLKVCDVIDSVKRQWLDDASSLVLATTQMNQRVGASGGGATGTKAHWDRYVTDDMAVVGNDLENAIWEEYGTGVHAEDGKGRKTPWYVPVDGYVGYKRSTFQGKVVVVYGKNGKRFYKTDGKKGIRPFRSAKDSCIPAIRRRLVELGGQLK